jgi:hypothetical protein
MLGGEHTDHAMACGNVLFINDSHRKYTAADVCKPNQEATDVENDRLDIQEKYLIQDISNTNGPLHSVQLCSMK